MATQLPFRIPTASRPAAPRRTALALLLAVLAAASCAPAAAQQTAPPAPPPAAAEAEADVRFIQMMIPHHQQALEMAALVPERTGRDDLRLMAERIDISQKDEIATMQRWLQAHGHGADAHAGHGAGGHDAAGHAHMPGMATPEEMAALAALRGPAFDRRFLELMIRHHEGALAMVGELFASATGGQSSEIYQIASEVDADQRMEIDRMRRLMDGPRTSPR